MKTSIQKQLTKATVVLSLVASSTAALAQLFPQPYPSPMPIPRPMPMPMPFPPAPFPPAPFPPAPFPPAPFPPAPFPPAPFPPAPFPPMPDPRVVRIPVPHDYRVGPQAHVYGRVAGQFGVNREGQVAAECVGQFGVSKAGAACVVGRLTVDELNKCFSDGIGGRGCFGDNNTMVAMIRGNFEAAKRERGIANQVIRGTTGISVRDIEQHGPLGGKNSEARKACNAVAGIFGGKC